jgi:hypothetical protein
MRRWATLPHDALVPASFALACQACTDVAVPPIVHSFSLRRGSHGRDERLNGGAGRLPQLVAVSVVLGLTQAGTCRLRPGAPRILGY